MEPIVEPTGLLALTWSHGAEAAWSHRATTKRLVPGDRLRGHGPADRPQATVPPDGEDRRAGTDPPRQAARAGRRGAAARHRSDGRRAAPAVHDSGRA